MLSAGTLTSLCWGFEVWTVDVIGVLGGSVRREWGLLVVFVLIDLGYSGSLGSFVVG